MNQLIFMAKLYNVLVITTDGIPISRISPERAVVNIMQGKQYMIQQQGTEVFRSQHHTVPVPAIVGLTSYHRLPDHYYGAARLSTVTLPRRDNWTCQYCGRMNKHLHKNEFLTRDHVFPLSRGGEDIWENVVLACITCNNRKRDRTPEEAGMTLLRKPFAPTRWQLNKKYVEAAMEDNDVLRALMHDTELELAGIDF